jgi:hypothetical protein
MNLKDMADLEDFQIRKLSQLANLATREFLFSSAYILDHK